MTTDFGWQALFLVAVVLAFIRSRPRPRIDAVDVAPLAIMVERLGGEIGVVRAKHDELEAGHSKTLARVAALEREQSIDIATREAAAREKSASLAVMAAEQIYKDKPNSGQDKARAAVTHLMSAHPGLTAISARVLVEAAIAQRVR